LIAIVLGTPVEPEVFTSILRFSENQSFRKRDTSKETSFEKSMISFEVANALPFN
jgi:hypothetical protein